MNAPKLLLETAFEAIAQHVESTYPEEGCGVVLVDAWGALEVRPLANAYDRYHQLDPEQYPRSNRTAYLFEPKAWLKLMNELDEGGKTLKIVFHSHVEVGAYFSKEDETQAVAAGEPVLPGVLYLVVAVDGGLAREGRLFAFRSGQFEEVDKYVRKTT